MKLLTIFIIVIFFYKYNIAQEAIKLPNRSPVTSSKWYSISFGKKLEIYTTNKNINNYIDDIQLKQNIKNLNDSFGISIEKKIKVFLFDNLDQITSSNILMDSIIAVQNLPIVHKNIIIDIINESSEVNINHICYGLIKSSFEKLNNGYSPKEYMFNAYLKNRFLNAKPEFINNQIPKDFARFENNEWILFWDYIFSSNSAIYSKFFLSSFRKYNNINQIIRNTFYKNEKELYTLFVEYYKSLSITDTNIQSKKIISYIKGEDQWRLNGRVKMGNETISYLVKNNNLRVENSTDIIDFPITNLKSVTFSERKIHFNYENNSKQINKIFNSDLKTIVNNSSIILEPKNKLKNINLQKSYNVSQSYYLKHSYNTDRFYKSYVGHTSNNIIKGYYNHTISDILNNYAIKFSLSLPVNFSGFETTLEYINNKQNIKWSLIFQRNSEKVYQTNQSDNSIFFNGINPNDIKIKYYKIINKLRYPLNPNQYIFNNVDISSNKTYFPLTSQQAIHLKSFYEYYFVSQTGFQFSNLLFEGNLFNPINGEAILLAVNNYINLKYPKTNSSYLLAQFVKALPYKNNKELFQIYLELAFKLQGENILYNFFGYNNNITHTSISPINIPYDAPIISQKIINRFRGAAINDIIANNYISNSISLNLPYYNIKYNKYNNIKFGIWTDQIIYNNYNSKKYYFKLSLGVQLKFKIANRDLAIYYSLFNNFKQKNLLYVSLNF